MRIPSPLLDALSMGLLNLCAALILLGMCAINAAYHWPNLFVTFAAPLGAAFFFVLTIVWVFECMRRWRSVPRQPTILPRHAAHPHRLWRWSRAASNRISPGTA